MMADHSLLSPSLLTHAAEPTVVVVPSDLVHRAFPAAIARNTYNGHTVINPGRGIRGANIVSDPASEGRYFKRANEGEEEKSPETYFEGVISSLPDVETELHHVSNHTFSKQDLHDFIRVTKHTNPEAHRMYMDIAKHFNNISGIEHSSDHPDNHIPEEFRPRPEVIQPGRNRVNYVDYPSSSTGTNDNVYENVFAPEQPEELISHEALREGRAESAIDNVAKHHKRITKQDLSSDEIDSIRNGFMRSGIHGAYAALGYNYNEL